MWYLYLGYVLVQLYPLIEKLNQVEIAPSALFFSLIVFFIWSFIPIVGYCLARLFFHSQKLNNTPLIFIGVLVGLIEDGLFYIDVLHYKEHAIAATVSFILFFCVAMLAKASFLANFLSNKEVSH
ncbi:hypothetical protein [Thalassotalea sp. PLHSN55]|uniref:hypothetical protein n=1 Tax=Thalassotalea sp. PLHSN55 TaxID=3435888 RepID=UPI003F840887